MIFSNPGTKILVLIAPRTKNIDLQWYGDRYYNFLVRTEIQFSLVVRDRTSIFPISQTTPLILVILFFVISFQFHKQRPPNTDKLGGM